MSSSSKLVATPGATVPVAAVVAAAVTDGKYTFAPPPSMGTGGTNDAPLNASELAAPKPPLFESYADVGDIYASVPGGGGSHCHSHSRTHHHHYASTKRNAEFDDEMALEAALGSTVQPAYRDPAFALRLTSRLRALRALVIRCSTQGSGRTYDAVITAFTRALGSWALRGDDGLRALLTVQKMLHTHDPLFSESSDCLVSISELLSKLKK